MNADNSDKRPMDPERSAEPGSERSASADAETGGSAAPGDSEILPQVSSSEAEVLLAKLASSSAARGSDDPTLAYSEPHEPTDPGEPPSPEDEPAPERLGRYRILRTLGKGAFARVFLARDELLNCDVAIKYPTRRAGRSPSADDSFLGEARAVAAVAGPNIVRVRDVCREEGGGWYVVMDYIEGESLADRIARGPVGAVESARIVEKVARAVHAAHKRGFVHRDLKPANILLNSSGEPFVADFGLALHEDLQEGRKGELAGTLRYMAPEQIHGDAHHLDGRTDVWALGTVLYELLARRPPFRSSDPSSLREEIERRPPRPLRQFREAVPAELERICLKCLEKDVSDRYASASDLADDLARWLAAGATQRIEIPPPMRFSTSRRPRSRPSPRRWAGTPSPDPRRQSSPPPLPDRPRFRQRRRRRPPRSKSSSSSGPTTPFTIRSTPTRSP